MLGKWKWNRIFQKWENDSPKQPPSLFTWSLAKVLPPPITKVTGRELSSSLVWLIRILKYLKEKVENRTWFEIYHVTYSTFQIRLRWHSLSGKRLFGTRLVSDGPHDHGRAVFVALEQLIHYIQMVSQHLKTMEIGIEDIKEKKK